MQSNLLDKLDTFARTPLLLVACDYDGTLAEVVPNPARAFPHASALQAFGSTSDAPWTSTAVISGRPVADLVRFLGSTRPDYIVGSHGAEWQRSGVTLTTEERDRLLQIAGLITAVVESGPGLRHELKPAGVALHVRTAEPRVAEAAVATATERCGMLPGIHIRHGSQVVEFMVVSANKGDAVKRARHAAGATGVLFIGDDITDEDVFKSLTTDDVSVKVGDGDTAARHRVTSVSEVAEILHTVAARRVQWAKARHLISLDACAVLSDQRTAAVVAPGARISWLCLPRLDSAALFAELVGDSTAGMFEISPAEGGAPLRCGYDGDSFMLVTEWPGLRVTDYLDASAGRAFQKAGRADLIRVIEGASPARIRFAPRLDYGRIATQLRIRDDGLEVEGSNDPIVLRSSGVQWTIASEGVHHTAEAIVQPALGPIVLELRYGTANLSPTTEAEPERRDQNRRFWSGWAKSLKLPARCPELVKRSALVLKALCYGPSGVIAAAATTSLAMQNILGDLFASLTIALDKPFVIGDFIVVGSEMGTVEHVGLKTTRVRSLSGEQLVFGNADLLSSRVRNYKRMSERRVVFGFGVVYATPPETLEAINAIVRRAVEAQSNVRFDRCHFYRFGASSLDFEAVYYINSPDYNAHMDAQQSAHLSIARAFRDQNIEFAYPTQTLYLSDNGAAAAWAKERAGGIAG